MRIDYGDTFTATTDEDGFPAVRIRNQVWVQDDDWITASAYDSDQESNVRNLAAALVQMADAMARKRGS